ncbi:MAG: ATP-binding protein, partial [Bacteroidota bacterium]
NNKIEAESLIRLGHTNLKLDKPNIALQQFRTAITAARTEGIRKEESEAALALYDNLKKRGQYQEALQYLELHESLEDSLFNEERTKQITRLEAEYEFDKEKQSLIYQAEKEKLEFNSQLQKERTRQLITVLVLGIGLILLYLTFRFKQLKRKNALEQEQLNAAVQKQKLALEQQERKRLEEVDSFKSRFFTNISHELRTPLTIINGMAGQIEKKPETWANKGAQMIRQNAQSLLQLVNQILDLRRLDNDQLQPDMVQDDVLRYLQYIILPYQSHASNKKIKFKTHLPDAPILMDFDQDKLLKIVSNLLSNAIKFTLEGGEILFFVQKVENQLQIEVRDTGIGIARDQLPYIFNRYYQADHINNINPNSSGIGLSLTYELVKLLNGTIQVESELGKGTQFFIHLPISQQAKVKQANSIVEEHTISKESIGKPVNSPKKASKDLPKLLLVEDHPDMVQFLVACLENTYQLEIARDGEEGIKKAIDQIPDLIVSDVMMPKKDGFELCKVLKNDERTSHIPIILLTAKADIDSKLEGLGQGAEAYLDKPFEERELILRLEKLLELRKKLQAHYSNFQATQLPPPPAAILENAFLTKIYDIVKVHLADTAFGITHLCTALNMSRSQLFRKIKALTGKSPTVFIRSIRLHEARHLLKTTDLSISEIAYRVGFSTPNYFSTSFLEEFGQQPNTIRN